MRGNLKKIQSSVKKYLMTLRKVKSHKPNQSSIRLKANRESISNIDLKTNDEDYKKPVIEDQIFVENFRIGNATYSGEMVNGERNGRGTQIWDDGAKYEGFWKNNKAHGFGTFYHIDGDIYQGQWENDQANGYGTYIHADGTQYTGNWKNDLQDGYGIEKWTDGSNYKGDYVLGKKKEQVIMNGLMEVNLLVIGGIIKLMEKGFIHG